MLATGTRALRSLKARIALGVLHGVAGLVCRHPESGQRIAVADMGAEGQRAGARVVVVGQVAARHLDAHVHQAGGIEQHAAPPAPR